MFKLQMWGIFNLGDQSVSIRFEFVFRIVYYFLVICMFIQI